jgi:hypothetical protein
MLSNDARQNHPPRRRTPVWPFWLAFGLLLPVALAGVGVTALMSATSASALAEQERLLVGSDVVLGTFVEAEPVNALPEINGIYEVTLPGDAPGSLAGTTQRVTAAQNVGFPPSDEFPSEQDILVSYSDGDVIVEDTGDPGTIQHVTNDSIDAARASSTGITILQVVSWVWLALVLTVLPTIAIRIGLRRRLGTGVGQRGQ